MVDALVPGGLSNGEIKTLMQSKRRDLFGAPAGGTAGLSKPQTQVNFSNPLPTENVPVAGQVAQPFGELFSNLYYDPKFRAETAKYGAQSAAATAGTVGAAAATPYVL